MHGKNPIRKQQLREDGRLWIQEIFATVQGEGLYAGTPSIFIRLAGCNLACFFCDTDFESAFEDKENFVTVNGAATAVSHLSVEHPGCNNIVFTGGEPFRQNFIPLAARLIDLGYTIEIETAGTIWIDDFDLIAPHCHVTVSPKTMRINPHIERVAGAYKYIVSKSNSSKGMYPTTEKGVSLPPPKFNQPIFIQPMDHDDEHIKAANIEATINLALRTGWRLSVQTHKYLGML